MKSVIYCFSGTGNSLRTARIIADVLKNTEIVKAFETVENILSSKGAHLSYARTIRCVASQCIAYPPFPPERLMLPLMEKSMSKTGCNA